MRYAGRRIIGDGAIVWSVGAIKTAGSVDGRAAPVRFIQTPKSYRVIGHHNSGVTGDGYRIRAGNNAQGRRRRVAAVPRVLDGYRIGRAVVRELDIRQPEHLVGRCADSGASLVPLIAEGQGAISNGNECGLAADVSGDRSRVGQDD